MATKNGAVYSWVPSVLPGTKVYTLQFVTEDGVDYDESSPSSAHFEIRACLVKEVHLRIWLGGVSAEEVFHLTDLQTKIYQQVTTIFRTVEDARTRGIHRHAIYQPQRYRVLVIDEA